MPASLHSHLLFVWSQLCCYRSCLQSAKQDRSPVFSASTSSRNTVRKVCCCFSTSSFNLAWSRSSGKWAEEKSAREGLCYRWREQEREALERKIVQFVVRTLAQCLSFRQTSSSEPHSLLTILTPCCLTS